MTQSRFAARRAFVAEKLREEGLDALVVTHLTHVRYLSGFTGSNGGLVLKSDGWAKVATDGRYTTQISQQVPDLEALNARACGAELLAELKDVKKVGFEADYVTVTGLHGLEDKAPAGVELVPVSGLIEKSRIVKDDEELAALRDVAALATEALDEMIAAGELAVGRKEIEVACDLEYRMRKLGAAHTSFDTIVASGENSALPHHAAGDRVIGDGDIVTIDYGAHRAGYNSDCTRTFIMGHTTEFSKEIYDLVHRAQQAGIDAARAGATDGSVDKAARDIIEEAGYGEYFVHSTGHGIGLDVHERPWAARNMTTILEPGMTVTSEPGIYIPGKGGVRIEDTLIITDADPEIITTYSKDLTVL